MALTKSFADVGSELGDMSDRTGVSVEALGELKFAAEQTGSNLETVEGGLRKMERALSDAASGSKKGQEALARIGLTVQYLASLAPEDQFDLIAKRITASGTSAGRLQYMPCSGGGAIESLTSRCIWRPVREPAGRRD